LRGVLEHWGLERLTGLAGRKRRLETEQICLLKNASYHTQIKASNPNKLKIVRICGDREEGEPPPFGTGDVGGGGQRWDVWLAWSSGRHRGAGLGRHWPRGLIHRQRIAGSQGPGSAAASWCSWGHRAMSTTIAAEGEVCGSFCTAEYEWVDLFR
jgi:hypothetical protein